MNVSLTTELEKWVQSKVEKRISVLSVNVSVATGHRFGIEERESTASNSPLNHFTALSGDASAI